jgi:hypothetical protein
MLPFKQMSPILVIEMIKAAVFWLNAFPITNGVSDQLSPRTIVTGRMIDYTKHCKYEFGEYVQTHEEHDNSMATRTVGALALRPTGNAQGSWYFMSLSTGRILNRAHGTRLPMPEDVIDRVHTIARRQKANPGLVFSDRNDMLTLDDIDDIDDLDDESYSPSEHDNHDTDDDTYDSDDDDDDDPNDDDDDRNNDDGNEFDEEPLEDQFPGVNAAEDGAAEDGAEDGAADGGEEIPGVDAADDGVAVRDNAVAVNEDDQ